MGMIRSEWLLRVSTCIEETGSFVGVIKPSSATGVLLLIFASIGFSWPSIDFLLIAGAWGIFFNAFFAASNGLAGSGVSLAAAFCS